MSTTEVAYLDQLAITPSLIALKIIHFWGRWNTIRYVQKALVYERLFSDLIDLIPYFVNSEYATF